MSFAAQFHGECPGCGEDMKGDEVEFVFDVLRHVVCPEPRPAAEQCPRCWTELPASGECGVC